MTQKSPNSAFKVGTSAEQYEGVWLGTYTKFSGDTAVVAEGFPTKEQAQAAADRFLLNGQIDSDSYEWRPDSKYPDRYAVYRKRRIGSELVRESR